MKKIVLGFVVMLFMLVGTGMRVNAQSVEPYIECKSGKYKGDIFINISNTNKVGYVSYSQFKSNQSNINTLNACEGNVTIVNSDSEIEWKYYESLIRRLKNCKDITITGLGNIVCEESNSEKVNFSEILSDSVQTLSLKNAIFAYRPVLSFSGKKSLLEILMSLNGEYIIGYDCFYNCNSLNSIVFSNSEKDSIRFQGDNVFKGCNSLEKINLGSMRISGDFSTNMFKGSSIKEINLQDCTITGSFTLKTESFLTEKDVSIYLPKGLEYTYTTILDGRCIIQGDKYYTSEYPVGI